MTRSVWVLTDRGWHDGEARVVAVYASEEAAEARRKVDPRRFDVSEPVPFRDGDPAEYTLP